MFRAFTAYAATAAVILAITSSVSAQERSTEFESRALPGLTFTPSIAVGGLWDSNVGVAGNRGFGQKTERDVLFTLEPQGLLEFRNNRTEFAGGFKGYLRRYVEIDELNGFDQRLFLSFQRMATKRLMVFARNEYADVPTTDEVPLNGIPFSRTGSLSNRFATGIELRLSKYDDLALRYDNTWVSFDNESTFLRGGILHEVRVDYDRRLSERVKVGSEYRLRRAVINNALNIEDVMWFHDIGGTVEYALGPHLTLHGAGGYSVLRDPITRDRSAPYLRGELTRDTERMKAGFFYQRSFAPSFGFGGSTESQELRGYVHMPISRNRFYVHSTAGWSRTDPLERLADLELDTFTADSTVGYSLSRAFRLEGFYIYTRQDSRITGGEVNRHRTGAQFVISQPVRIR